MTGVVVVPEGTIVVSAQGLKPLDADIEFVLETLAIDAEINADFEAQLGPMGGELDEIAALIETTVRRLVREAGYALPETVCGD